MADKKNPSQVNDKAREIIEESRKQSNGKQFILWMAALVIGGALGWMNNPSLNELFNFIATIFTRMFQFIAVPTIALAVITTLSALGAKKDTKRIFAHTLVYTLLTTICSAAVGLALYLWIAPGNLAGVDYGSPDGLPAKLLFMIAATPDGDVHMEVLARMMQLLMSNAPGTHTTEMFLSSTP